MAEAAFLASDILSGPCDRLGYAQHHPFPELGSQAGDCRSLPPYGSQDHLTALSNRENLLDPVFSPLSGEKSELQARLSFFPALSAFFAKPDRRPHFRKIDTQIFSRPCTPARALFFPTRGEDDIVPKSDRVRAAFIYMLVVRLTLFPRAGLPRYR